MHRPPAPFVFYLAAFIVIGYCYQFQLGNSFAGHVLYVIALVLMMAYVAFEGPSRPK